MILLGLIAYPAHCVPKTVKQCIQTQCPCLIATWLLFVRTIALLAVAIVLCAPVSAQGQARMGELSRWLLDQVSPVRKAKFFPKLGDAYLEFVRQQVKSGDYDQALTVLEAYIEAANKLHRTLRAAVPDPENKSEGFKQLEAHLRSSIRYSTILYLDSRPINAIPSK